MTDSIYNFKAIENKWKKIFSKYKVKNSDITKKNKKYILEMLPYPSGKCHMGHVRNYVIGDVITRYYSMNGYCVIHPMGWDSFGLPAENAAIQSHSHPRTWTEDNIKCMKSDLQNLGYMYDWEREISTCSKKYYALEQKIFLDMYKHDLVYRKKSYVNWDPIEMSVLANEQVIDGKGWRSGATIEKKMLEQWSIRITKYADELLEGLKDLSEDWPENVIKMQENWIGKSEGVVVNFDCIDVYTTRPDTLFGASFIALSPDHPISQELSSNNDEIKKFIDECKTTMTSMETIEKTEKKGVFTGIYVKNPIKSDKNLPVYIANFVLMDYGTGAVFGCPAHDERDYEFAVKYGLKIVPVIENSSDKLPYTGDGVHTNSDFLNGLNVAESKKTMINYLEKNKLGTKKTAYKLRDWLVSRQRYWGCPIPFIHCPKCGIVPANDLPILLPDDVLFKKHGNPLEHHPTWKHVECPVCNDDTALRETDTLDTFFESSWYFLRYLDKNSKDPVNREITQIAMPVDLYIGGIEHAVLHLLYARFFTLALRDMGYFSGISHPFKKLLTQGMVCYKSYKNDKNGEWLYPEEVKTDSNGNLCDKNGNSVTEGPFEKMSKSKKNLINPGKIIDSHGVDAVRLFIISDTPPEKDFDWNTDALNGTYRFLKRIWKLFNIVKNLPENGDINPELQKNTYIYIKKISECIESTMLNRAIAYARELFNVIEKTPDRWAFIKFLKAICPITPFISHEILEILGKNAEKWPKINENLTINDRIVIAIQINGKLRGKVEVANNIDEETLKTIALKKLKINEKNTKRIIVVKNKIVSIVL
ncbi:MAG: leucine--tRNA ligase [Holosporales bacterium]|jgi:leucyl-tRNA synthetase|nr:leucine--tRNA ligase [Holosporales bacterium]